MLLLGAPPSILLVGHDLRAIWHAIVSWRRRCATTRAPRRGADGRSISIASGASSSKGGRSRPPRRWREAAIRCCARSGRSCCSRAAAARCARRWPRCLRAAGAHQRRRGRLPLLSHHAGGRPDGDDRRPGEHADEPAQLRADRPGHGGGAAGDVLRPHPGLRDLGTARQADRELRARPLGQRACSSAAWSASPKGARSTICACWAAGGGAPTRSRRHERRTNAGAAAPRAARAREPEPTIRSTTKRTTTRPGCIPYVDVISLLLAFLILTLAMSKVSLRKFELSRPRSRTRRRRRRWTC